MMMSIIHLITAVLKSFYGDYVSKETMTNRLSESGRSGWIKMTIAQRNSRYKMPLSWDWPGPVYPSEMYIFSMRLYGRNFCDSYLATLGAFESAEFIIVDASNIHVQGNLAWMWQYIEWGLSLWQLCGTTFQSPSKSHEKWASQEI